MYSSEFAQVSFLSMSNSKLFLVKEDEEGIEFDILNRPTLEFQDECPASASHDPQLHQQQQQEQEQEHEEKQEDYKCEITVSYEELERSTFGELKVEDEDDDGFKTPTSLDHKIAVIKQCPPAPRKPKPPSAKRKVSPHARRSLNLDLSQELESMFPRPILADLHRKIKKARREEVE